MIEGMGIPESSHLYSLAACKGHDNANWSSCFILKVAFGMGICFLVPLLLARLLALSLLQ